MELSDLGREYLERADRLLQRIHELNAICKDFTGNEKIVLKRRILSLYFDAAECRKLAKMLMSYKGGENKK
jgi:DNA-binding transcriptional LysR family regulator